MRTITAAKTSGDKYTARTEVIESATTVSGDDEDEQGENGEQASEEDDTSTPRFRSGELVASKLVNLTGFHLDPRTPKPGHEQVHLSTELRLVYDHPYGSGIPLHTRFWAGSTVDIDGNTTTNTATKVFLTTSTDEYDWTKVAEWTHTLVKVRMETDGENNRGENCTETVFEEEIETETVTTNDNNGR
ncbi:uncharacterized protein FIESC28_05543 [Fusarium coffeatum]|uniref:Uncharacterized protein n=1 Tax=Fusarium coffeatum TaxID=231269 RepID=A0A366RSK5_9HYPO|nr:uncharacterized protein FIESC28_05543 [Fusarium coffeatum]RBR19548.1 hypothetical protein FIESC28_05543 [Fusarium coffeatum]